MNVGSQEIPGELSRRYMSLWGSECVMSQKSLLTSFNKSVVEESLRKELKGYVLVSEGLDTKVLRTFLYVTPGSGRHINTIIFNLYSYI